MSPAQSRHTIIHGSASTGGRQRRDSKHAASRTRRRAVAVTVWGRFGGLKNAVRAVMPRMTTPPATHNARTGSKRNGAIRRRGRRSAKTTAPTPATINQAIARGPRRMLSNAPSNSVISTSATARRVTISSKRHRATSNQPLATDEPPTGRYFFLPCAATASIAACTFSASPR